jgi:hypothetical protein
VAKREFQRRPDFTFTAIRAQHLDCQWNIAQMPV